MNRAWSVVAFALVATGGVQLADAAVTDPELSYGGNFCQPYAGYSSVPVHVLSGFYNGVNANRYALCPAVAKDPERLTGTTFAPVWYYNPGGFFTCSLYSLDVNGHVVAGTTLTQSTTGQQVLYFQGPTTSSEWGSYLYVCTMTPYSYVNGYMVYEGD
jgi:hypothetical protein